MGEFDKVLTERDVEIMEKEFPPEPEEVKNARSRAKQAAERLGYETEAGPWELVYSTSDPEPEPENAAWKAWLRHTAKVEYWGLGNNRQNFTQVKAIDARLEQAGVKFTPIDPGKRGTIENVIADARKNPDIKVSPEIDKGPTEPYQPTEPENER